MENIDLSILSTTINETDSIISPQNNADSESKIDAPKKPFPTDVFKWMKANAKPQMALKLMQICKYFQHHQFPYFVVKRFTAFGDHFKYADLNDVHHNLEKIANIPKNLWIIDEIKISKFTRHSITPLIIPKIVVVEAKTLELSHEEILFSDFKILTSSGNIRKLVCFYTSIRDKNNEIVPLEDILDCLPNIEYIWSRISIPSFSTVEAAKKEWFLPNLKTINFQCINIDFDTVSFIQFMKNHKTIKFNLHFRFLRSFDYAPQLQAFIDEIIAAADLRYRPPWISFPFQTEESKEALKALNQAFAQK